MVNRKRQVVAVTLFLVLTIASVAYAAHTTINTDDGQLDANWGNVSVMSNDGDDFANDNYDIDQGWAANASDNSAFYFRVNLVGTGQLPHDYSSFEARLDCNRNGSFQDSGDVVVYYAITGSSEELVECQGDEYPSCDYTAEPNNSDTNAATFGEELSGTPYNYEWRADVNNGSTDWSSCFGQINVQFVSLDSAQTAQDTTTWHGYNVPTAVYLTDFAAKQSLNLTIVAVIAISILVLLVSGWLVQRLAGRLH